MRVVPVVQPHLKRPGTLVAAAHLATRFDRIIRVVFGRVSFARDEIADRHLSAPLPYRRWSILFDGQAFTPQTTPSSERTITVTSAVLPDREDGSGSMTNLIRVGEGLIGGIGGQSLFGDIAAPMAPADTFTPPKRVHYYTLNTATAASIPDLTGVTSDITGSDAGPIHCWPEPWNNGTNSRCEFLEEGVLLMPGALRSPLKLGGAVAGVGALVSMALPTWPTQSRWGPDQPLVETWHSWFDINIAFWSANYAVILAATACVVGCLSLGLGWRSGARLRTAAGFFIASGVLGVVGAVFFPEPIGINLVSVILASVAGVLLTLERRRDTSNLPRGHLKAV